MQFLGIKIDEVSKEQALEKVSEFLNGGLPGGASAKSGQHQIFTPNPEMAVKAQKDEYFKKVLNAGDLNLCDGKGLALALRFFGGLNCHPEQSEGSLSGVERDSSHPFRMTKKIVRITGVDFMMDVCALAAKWGSGVYLLGSGSDEVVRNTADNLQKQFPNLRIIGFDKGPEIGEFCHSEYPSGHKLREESLSIEKGSFTSVQDDSVTKINSSDAEILFVAFGSPKQEKWIYENLPKMPSVKIAMGVGGSFDFISGKAKRAPLFLRRLGLEWMYRLIQEPRRLGRIFNATIKFVYLVLKSKFSNV